MTIAEYYGFPEGTNARLKYCNFYDIQEDNFPCNTNMNYAYSNEEYRYVAKLRDTTDATSMAQMFKECNNLCGMKQFDTSNVTNMSYMFSGCYNLPTIPYLNTSNVTDMSYMFNGCSNLITIPQLDTSNVTNVSNIFSSCTKLKSIPALQAGKWTGFSSYSGPIGYSNMTELTDVGGFIGLKSSMPGYALEKCPSLTRESCINIMNGLYDFVGNGETPTSSQGKLKVHANFLTAVGDDISIATNKGWTITT